MLSPQTKVGFLIIAGILGIATVIFTLGDITLKKGYEFYILFDDIADLPSRSAVKISGVNVGRVSSIKLYKGRARVKVWIEDDVQIYKNTRPKILRMGLIGHTYLSITMGTSEYPVIKEGDIIEGISPLSYEKVIDDLVSKINEFSEIFKGLETEYLINNISGAFSNIKEVSGSLNYAIGKRGENLKSIIENLDNLSNNLNSIFGEKEGAIKSSIANINTVSRELKLILTDVRAGKGLVGKIFTSVETEEKIDEMIHNIYLASQNLSKTMDRVKGISTYINAKIFYDLSEELFRSYSSLTLLTGGGKYLNVGIENIRPEGSIFDAGNDRANALTLKAGRQFGNFTVFGGLIRASGGVGASWNWKERVEISSKIFEFSRNNPWLSVSSKLMLTDFISIGLSYENILEEGSLRAGFGIYVK